MEGTEALQVDISEQFNLDLKEVYQYGLETFGLAQAESYENDIWQLIEGFQQTICFFWNVII